MKIVYLIIGTRPEAVKMAPVFRALKQKTGIQLRLISTGQHRELLQQTLKTFELMPDCDLNVMKPGQSLSALTANLLIELEKLFKSEKPDFVLTHGDTTTCYATALSSFYHSIPFFHVEAGLRTFRLDSPFPEEFNRQCVSRMAAHHFAPNEDAKKNLLEEGVDPRLISVIGSTAHDAIRLINSKAPTITEELLSQIKNYKRSVLLTLHRRDEGTSSTSGVMSAVKETATLHPETIFIFPIHPNPLVRALANSILSSEPNILLTSPLDYPCFLSVLNQSSLVITDSGGVQEEAAFFGKRALICRDMTERHDGMDSHTVKVVGTDPKYIVSCISKELRKPMALRVRKNKAETSASQAIANIVAEKCFA